MRTNESTAKQKEREREFSISAVPSARSLDALFSLAPSSPPSFYISTKRVKVPKVVPCVCVCLEFHSGLNDGELSPLFFTLPVPSFFILSFSLY